MPKGAKPLARVLLVDDDPRSLQLLQACLHADGHELTFAADGEGALAAVADQTPDLVLLDLVMPGVDGFAVLQRLKAEAETRLVPVVVVTGLAQRDERLRAIELGADEFLSKPVDRIELLARVRALLRLKQHVDQLERTENVLRTIARTVEARDPALQEHCERLARWTTSVGAEFGLGEADLDTLRLGAYVHDIGKIGIPDSVLLKPGPLSEAERAMVRMHPVIGESILAPLASMAPVLPLVRHHHERLDGTGYPDRLHGGQITLPVRILAAVDVLDALTTHRPYRAALPISQAMEILQEEARRGWWDADVVACLAERVVPLA